MRVVQCPDKIEDIVTQDDTVIFLGGGISNCPDWQKEMIQRFKTYPDDLILVNPRRENFDVSNPKESEFQIDWEHHHLSFSSAVLFWFPYHTLCPITLYELGMQAGMQNTFFVGCHPAYARKFDVEHQLILAGHPLPVVDNFAALVEQVKFWYDN